MTDNEKRKIEKQIKIDDLFFHAIGIPEMKYFDHESDQLLDDKIEVLEAIKAGKPIEEIPKFYDILELMPDEGIWD